MTKKEVIKILAVCKEVGVPFATDSDKKMLVEIWHRAFLKEKYEDVSRALFELINTKKGLFLNGLIAELKSRIVADKQQFDDFAMVWEQIRTAAHNTYPDVQALTEKAFRSLPPILQHLVGSARHLEEMEYTIDRDVLETVEKSNFKKMYSELVIQAKQDMQLGKLPVWHKDIKQIADTTDTQNKEKKQLNVTKLIESHTFTKA